MVNKIFGLEVFYLSSIALKDLHLLSGIVVTIVLHLLSGIVVTIVKIFALSIN